MGVELWVDVIGMGTVAIETKEGKKIHQGCDVMPVPDLDQNLLSIGQLNENGHHVYFRDDFCDMFDKEDKSQKLNVVTARKYDNKGAAKSGIKKQKKSQAFEMFKIFQTEVERQLEKKIKIVRSDRGDEYYGRFDEGGRLAGPFARIVEIGCAKFIEHEKNPTGNKDFVFEEKCDVVVIENAEQDVTSLIPLSETVLENPQFEEPVEPQEQAVENPELDKLLGTFCFWNSTKNSFRNSLLHNQQTNLISHPPSYMHPFNFIRVISNWFGRLILGDSIIDITHA
ncbi:hypothetical protein L3X38_005493 [Prunus dulcis]|uniref:Retrovirus-related Pol polyprotein from transposon TNT 1-94-like beta-barrel domain-containing protein n=1 Tax=Prunus dulcis TaxID=3755 RepID=A0AAD4ZR28_PRUDU|nr:hypothetical protein L3X38_005493 [Prunus dulcis]